MATTQGKIKVTADNIFPIIKKFLYSDHEIFLRELISNATDASSKLKALSQMGEIQAGELDKLQIEIKIDKDKKTLHILDQGIGMSAEEIEKYINQIAFSGAEEFLEKYKDKPDATKGIIGHFGLGFYSSFMVADKVEILSKSYKSDQEAIHWACDGSPNFSLSKGEKTSRGTEIILHISKDCEEFLEEYKIKELLTKYCKFMPIPIKMGEREETIKSKEGEKEKQEKIKVDDIINNPMPAWIKKPSELSDEDYKNFYRELYPMQFEEPLFWIHLNIEHPFKLTGILFFPRLKNQVEIHKDKIQLYQNQVFVTDNLEGVVPDFLNLLRGVIDSPDIPLNVSRSYLQADATVKKISGYISKKVADKIENLFKNNRIDLEKKWEDIKIILEYGMLSDENFFGKIRNIFLYKTVEDKYLTFDEFTELIKEKQKNKHGKLIYLYSSNKEAQYSYISDAKERDYEVLLLDSPLSSPIIQKLEVENQDISFIRIDANHIDRLVEKDLQSVSKLSEEEKENLKKTIENQIDKQKFVIQIEDLESSSNPFTITIPEFMRRMKEMSAVQGGMFGGNLPETYNLIINSNHDLIAKILEEKNEDLQKERIKNAIDLAMLSQNLLSGEDLTKFVKRSFEKLNF